MNDVNHVNGYHGSDKDRCLYCMKDKVDECLPCPVREDMEKLRFVDEENFKESLRDIRRSLTRAQQIRFDKLLSRANMTL